MSDNDSAPVVILVEDEVLIRMSIADYLRSCGYQVIEAGSADEAVVVIDSETRIDVVFTDVKMPGSMDGFGLARWVRQRLPDIPVILTSGVARSTEIARELCEDGPLMAKPYQPRQVEARIRQLLTAAATARSRR
jgi:CheY-like chemotaxis protein